MAITSFVFEWNDFMAAYLIKYDREKDDTTYNKALIATSGLKG
jgi:ABC-type glycerol-3-phosphate transport system permease component